MKQHESGFSIVELVVTLGVAFVFLMAGYLLHQSLITRGASSQWRLKASNIAASHITDQRHKAESPCKAKTLPAPSIESGTLPGSPTANAKITCPYGTSSSISRITVTVTYEEAQTQEVVRARDIYVE